MPADGATQSSRSFVDVAAAFALPSPPPSRRLSAAFAMGVFGSKPKAATTKSTARRKGKHGAPPPPPLTEEDLTVIRHILAAQAMAVKHFSELWAAANLDNVMRAARAAQPESMAGE